MLKLIRLLIAILSNGTDSLEYKKRLHNAGYCYKAKLGYRCKGSNDYKECGSNGN